MTLTAGLLHGFADGVEKKRAREDRERALSVLEAASKIRGDFNRAEVRPPGRGQPDPYPQGSVDDWDASAVPPEIAAGIYETADELGMDPEWLATYISYETGGTFNPRAKGPRTQHGQHEGLIQFGEPQAEQYGVDWNNPIGSQLGRDGAIVRYFRDNGWQPGMSELDGYSIINAGAPGRYNASDANNGGAAGTVRDKVESQMGGHRVKARTLLASYKPASSAPKSGEWFTSFFKGAQ